MPKKIAYRTATLERKYRATRDDTWAVVEHCIDQRVAGVTFGDPALTCAEVALSTEPPWRYVARLDGDHGSNLCQTTVTIRDDGPTCLVAWSCLVDPTDLVATDLERLLDQITEDGRKQLDAFGDEVRTAD